MLQAHIFYSGTVQGVGFRYTTREIAAELSLKGWVRNLSDGRVEILVEGAEDMIHHFMREIEKHFGGYIKDKQVNYSPRQNSLKDFQIVH